SLHRWFGRPSAGSRRIARAGALATGRTDLRRRGPLLHQSSSLKGYLMAWLADLYPWTKALHIISVIAWMAGVVYLPRLFVYHCNAAPGSAQAETFKTMERRLLRGIMNPAMVATYLFGIALLLTPGLVEWSRGWIYLKLILVAVLTVYHHAL